MKRNLLGLALALSLVFALTGCTSDKAPNVTPSPSTSVAPSVTPSATPSTTPSETPGDITETSPAVTPNPVSYTHLDVYKRQLQDLGPLLHAHRDVLHQGVRVHLQPVFVGQGQHLFPGLRLLQEAVLARLHAHNDIVQHREALHQLEVLVDHADPQRIGVVGVADLDLSLIHI